MSEARDIGRAVGNADATWFATIGDKGRGRANAFSGEEVDIQQGQFNPTVFLYDNFPGGLGISSGLFEIKESIIEKAYDSVNECQCEIGCPTCIGPILASSENTEYSPKAMALAVLGLLQQREVTYESTQQTLNATA